MKYPIGIQTFEEIVKRDFIYVDKTERIYNLAYGSKYNFLSRPRRFGKSLLLSTMKSYFSGRKDLFEGLAISKLEKEWRQYPVLYLDLNAKQYNDEGSLTSMLEFNLRRMEETYGTEVSANTPEERFNAVIHRAYELTGEKVVILIDEYDKPLISTIDKPELHEVYRTQLKGFYSNLKSCDEYIRFAFLTGVSRFSKLSIFSGLNNISDISMSREYADICGITETELHEVFDGSVAAMAEQQGMTKDECYAELKALYDGYHFCNNSPGLYNPWSLMCALRDKEFNNYWSETGTPELLVRQLQRHNYLLDDLTHQTISPEMLGHLDFDSPNPLPLFYQTGYLTLKDYDPLFREYRLDFPNREVAWTFTNYIYPSYAPRPMIQSPYSLSNFVRDVLNGDAEGFVKRLVALFADGNYQIVGNQEIYFQNTLYVFFKLMGFYVDVERHTSDGRLDIVLQTTDYIYIIEIKVDQSADVALRQIEDKHYAAPFAADPRRLFKIGLNFNSSRRTLDDWKVV